MIRALVYLQATSLRNALLGRARRLREPKYLIAALVGATYIWFFFISPAYGPQSRGSLPQPLGLPPPDTMALFASTGLFVTVALAWMFGADRGALRFTDAEIAFLFPAPLTRTALLHYKLLKSQLSILFSSFLIAGLSGGWQMGGGIAIRAVGWWVITSTLNLHFIAATFTRNRLFDSGLRPGVRRTLFTSVLLAVAAGVAFWTWRSRPEALPQDGLALVSTLLRQPPLGWILASFQWIVAPLFAPDGAALAKALGPALVILTLHYLWVIQSALSFEDAAIAQSAKIASLRTASDRGRWTPTEIKRPRPVPFTLAPGGSPVVAFLWKGWIGAGPRFYPRVLLLVGALLIGIATGGAHWTQSATLAKTLGAISGTLAVYGVILGPLWFRRKAHGLLREADLVKAYPVAGWQVVLGHLLVPMALLTAFEGVMGTLVAVPFWLHAPGETVSAATLFCSLVGFWAVTPPLAGAMFAANFGFVLLFPSWSKSTAENNPGLERLGQNLIGFAAYLVILLGVLIPAIALGGALGFVLSLLGIPLPAVILTGAGIAALILSAEFALVVGWLGGRYERLDVSTELSG